MPFNSPATDTWLFVAGFLFFFFFSICNLLSIFFFLNFGFCQMCVYMSMSTEMIIWLFLFSLLIQEFCLLIFKCYVNLAILWWTLISHCFSQGSPEKENWPNTYVSMSVHIYWFIYISFFIYWDRERRILRNWFPPELWGWWVWKSTGQSSSQGTQGGLEVTDVMESSFNFGKPQFFVLKAFSLLDKAEE